MPRKKAIKRKVKDVVVPEGDEGEDLTKPDRTAKLESFIEQFDFEVQQRLEELDKESRRDCKAIDHAVRSLILKMGPKEAKTPIIEYRKNLLNPGSQKKKESVEVCGSSNVNALLTETAQFPDPPARKGRKVTGFATPAAGATRHTMWTATPQQTPLFDKRLLNVKAGKPSFAGLSFYGKPITDDVISDKVAKNELVRELSELLRKLQSE